MAEWLEEQRTGHGGRRYPEGEIKCYSSFIAKGRG